MKSRLRSDAIGCVAQILVIVGVPLAWRNLAWIPVILLGILVYFAFKGE